MTNADDAAPVAITPAIMSGGVGSRLWPASRRSRPKQMHALVSDRTMIQETALRTQGAASGVAFRAPIVVTSESLGAATRDQLAEAGVPASAVIMEPEGRNTAPAAAAAALFMAESDREGLVLLLPADHYVADAAAFREAIARGAEAARAGRIVTYGVTPTAPETGYGYIRAGDSLDAGGAAAAARAVDAFVEKPLRHVAEEYLAAGGYFWNAGIFLFRADAMIAELDRHAPETLAGARAALEAAKREGAMITLDAAGYGRCPSEPIDIAVMEKTDRAAVAPMDVAWSDLGSWEALWAAAARDADNVASSAEGAVLLDVKDTLVWSNGPMVACVGVRDLVVVATPDAVLVLPRDQAQRAKDVVKQLEDAERSELL